MSQLSINDIDINYTKSWKGFWNTGIIEEAHWLASDEDGVIFNAQVSLNRWRSSFRLEINGTDAYGVVENRGRSYGPQSYRFGKRWGWQSGTSQAESEEIVVSNNDCTDSFVKEIFSVLNIQDPSGKFNSTSVACNYVEAYNAMKLLQKYRDLEQQGA
jgi:hypothetical protein